MRWRLLAMLAGLGWIGWRAARAGREASDATATRELTIVTCPLHGIAYDAERELCPECAKAPRRPASGVAS